MTGSEKFSVYRNRTLVLLVIVTFAMSLGMNSIAPIWPLYIQSLGAAMIEVSAVIALAGMAGTILRIPSGIISDRLGRRRLILASIIFAIIPPLFYMRATIWHNLIPWAILYGAAFAFLMPILIAWVTDLVEPSERAKAYSFLNIAFPIGSIVGPILGGMIVDNMSWGSLFMIVAMIHALCFLPFMLINDPGKAMVEPSGQPIETSSSIGQMSAFSLLIVLQFLFGVGFGLVSPMIPFFLTEKFGSTATEIGVFSSIGFGATAVLAQIPSARLSEMLGEEKLIVYCCSIIPLTFLLWPSRTGYLEVLILYMIATAIWSLTWSPMVTILMKVAPISKRGFYSGISDASIMFGFTVGPAVAGLLWDNIGHQVPFYASSLILGVSVPVALLLARSLRSQHDPSLEADLQ